VIDTDDWLRACRAATVGIQRSVSEARQSGSTSDLVGTVGAGGDATLVLDAVAEAHIFRELDGLGYRGMPFTAVSEERGIVEFGVNGTVVVAIDPIDGSLNARRMLVHHAVSIAVAEGPLVDDVVLGYVFDLGTQEEFVGIEGRGAWVDGTLIAPQQVERRATDGRLELLAVETNDARALAVPFERAGDSVSKVRVLGSIAAALCQLAVGRVDAMINVTRCRMVDIAAAALIAREAGVICAFPDDPEPRLDLEPRSSFAAGRTRATLAEMIAVMAGESS